MLLLIPRITASSLCITEILAVSKKINMKQERLIRKEPSATPDAIQIVTVIFNAL